MLSLGAVSLGGFDRKILHKILSPIRLDDDYRKERTRGLIDMHLEKSVELD